MTSHLSPATLVDLLDGVVSESDVPHLGTCESCQEQLRGLRAAWRAAAEAEVPEPSPLFWDHMSARVRAAVAAESAQASPWWAVDWSWRAVGLVSAAAAAVALVVQLQSPRRASDVAPGTPASSAVAIDDRTLEPLTPLPDDESLGFVVDLAGTVDWDDVPAFGFATRGDADRAVAEMTADERVELQRLLNEALAGGV